MALITVKTFVTNLTAVLSQFDQIKIHRSTTGEAGPYSELTAVGTRLALEEGKVVYEYTDVDGETTYYYRSSYYNSTTAQESSLSDPILGAGNQALSIMSVEQLKTNFLFGLDLTDDTGEPYPDSLYEDFIRGAVSRLEHYLDIPILPTVIAEERHDYYRDDYDKYLFLELDRFPVISVQTVKMVLPGDQEVQNFDSDWIHVEAESGHLQIVPGTGSLGTILLGAGGRWLPFVHTNLKYIPDVFRVAYTAGFEPGKVPPIISETVGKMASFGPLNIAGDLLGGAGIASQSIGIDGLHQSFNTTSSSTSAGYGARLIQYQKELKEVGPMLRNYYKGIRMRVV